MMKSDAKRSTFLKQLSRKSMPMCVCAVYTFFYIQPTNFFISLTVQSTNKRMKNGKNCTCIRVEVSIHNYIFDADIKYESIFEKCSLRLKRNEALSLARSLQIVIYSSLFFSYEQKKKFANFFVPCSLVQFGHNVLFLSILLHWIFRYAGWNWINISR